MCAVQPRTDIATVGVSTEVDLLLTPGSGSSQKVAAGIAMQSSVQCYGPQSSVCCTGVNPKRYPCFVPG